MNSVLLFSMAKRRDVPVCLFISFPVDGFTTLTYSISSVPPLESDYRPAARRGPGDQNFKKSPFTLSSNDGSGNAPSDGEGEMSPSFQPSKQEETGISGR